MIDFYLITGFLGAGKTTFLSNFILNFKDKKIRLVINEFGKAGVDGKLLSKLNILLDEIDNGSIFCTCRLDQFEKALGKIAVEKPDVVIVETSGLSDPTSVKKILQGNPNYKDYNYKGCICLVDAVNFFKVYSTARVCPRQLSISDLVVINKTDLADEQSINKVETEIIERYPTAKIRKTSFGAFDKDWLDLICDKSHEVEMKISPDLTLQNAFITIDKKMSPMQLTAMLNMICEDSNRMKGFVCLNGKNYLVDGVGTLVNVSEYNCDFEVDNVINILATAGMNLRKAMKKAISIYQDYVIDYKL